MSEVDLRKKVVDVVRAILQGDVDLLSGVRQVANLSRGLSTAEQSDPKILTFVAVDSELDDVPMGSARGLWAAEALAEKDRERDEYLGERETQSIWRAVGLLRDSHDVRTGRLSFAACRGQRRSGPVLVRHTQRDASS
jgi:hypothetical protein